MACKSKIDGIVIEHHPDNPHAKDGLEWYYSFGYGCDGYTRSEKEADAIICNWIKTHNGGKK